MAVFRLAVAAVVILALIPSAAAGDETAGRFALTPRAGVVIPTGDFASSEIPGNTLDVDVGYAKTGFAVGAALEYYFNEHFAAGIRLTYHRIGVDANVLESFYAGQEIEGHYTMWEYAICGQYAYPLTARLHPYAGIGLLLGLPSGTGDVSYGMFEANVHMDIDATWGLEFALGVRDRASDNIAYFIEAGYTTLFSDGNTISARTGSVSVDEQMVFNTTWFSIKVGVSFFLGGK